LANHLRAAPRPDRWRWRELVIGVPWVVSDPRECTPAWLRSRLEVVVQAWQALWCTLGLGGATGALLRIELSPWGFVHGHVIYYGPFFRWEWLSAEAKRHAPRVGKVTIGLVGERSGRSRREADGGVAAGLREALKYAVKLPSPISSWTRGALRRVVHPRVAAAWTIATADVPLVRTYGVWRGAVPDDAPEEASEQDSGRVPCPTCGASMDLGSARREPTVRVLARLHQRGLHDRMQLRGIEPPTIAGGGVPGAGDVAAAPSTESEAQAAAFWRFELNRSPAERRGAE
jgi:hypothetical protein